MELKRIYILLAFLCLTANQMNAQDFKTQQEQADFMHSRIDSVAIGKAVPGFTLYTESGDSLNLSDLKGKILVIDIWATWCKPCIALSPEFEKAKEKFESDRIRFISISTDDTKEKWLNYVKEHKVNYERFWIQPGKKQPIRWFTFDEFEFQGRKVWGQSVPKFILIDQYGKVTNVDFGQPGMTSFKKAIKRALKN